MRIDLGDGRVALIDDEDAEKCLACNWSVRADGYVIGYHRSERRMVRLSRYVMGVTDGRVVDHENHDLLDNRKANLRPATQSQNMGNCLTHRDKVSSKFKGVYWHGQSGRWMAACAKKYLGLFDVEEDAARAYDAGAVAKWGKFARINFPALVALAA